MLEALSEVIINDDAAVCILTCQICMCKSKVCVSFAHAAQGYILLLCMTSCRQQGFSDPIEGDTAPCLVGKK